MMNKRNAVRVKLSLTEIFYNFCFASANFLSVFLRYLGIGAGQIGIITSMTNIMNIVSQPVWGAASDRVGSVRKCLMMCLLGSGLCVVFIPALSQTGKPPFLAVNILVVLLYFFLTPANMLMELWLVRVNDSRELGISYGSIRSFASLGFAIMNLMYVPILARFPVYTVYYFYAVFAVIAAIFAWSMPADIRPGEAQKRQRLRDMPFRKIFTYWIGTYLLFEILFQIPFSWRNSYLIYALNEFGVQNSGYGGFLFIAGLCEVPMLLMSRRIIHRVGLAVPLMMSTILLAMEYGMYAFGHSVLPLYVGQILRGFAYALYVACRHQYVSRLAPEGMSGSTLALVNAAYAGVNIAAAVFGGFILQGMGARSFFALLAGIQIFAGVFFVCSHIVGRFARKRELPEELCLLRK